jgi:septal ring factor EnvC (AmiA/AmiB activator)
VATSKYKKSAKDLAFEREKTNLQARNFQLCRELAEAQKGLETAKKELEEVRARNAELVSYIEETTGCCPETLKKDIKNREMIAGLLRFSSQAMMYGGFEL